MEIIDQKILHDSVRWPLSPEYQGMFPGEIIKQKAIAGDIVMANKNGDKKIIALSEYEAHANKYIKSGYEPIAVVVVPATHTDDGTARCMALTLTPSKSHPTSLDRVYGQFLDYDNVQGGTYYFEKIGLTDVINLNIIGLDGWWFYRVYGTSTISSMTGFFGVSLDHQTVQTGALYNGPDIISKYTQSSPGISPYGADGVSKNPDYFVLGGMCDHMDGYDNSRKLYMAAILRMGDEYHEGEIVEDVQYKLPLLVNTCGYSTKGTRAADKNGLGDWYLPAAGEILYISPRSNDILNGFLLAGGTADSGLGKKLNLTSAELSPSYELGTSSVVVYTGKYTDIDNTIYFRQAPFTYTGPKSGSLVHTTGTYCGAIPFIKI